MNPFLIVVTPHSDNTIEKYLSEFVVKTVENNFLLQVSAFATLKKLNYLGYSNGATYQVVPERDVQNISSYPVFDSFEEAENDLKQRGADMSLLYARGVIEEVGKLPSAQAMAEAQKSNEFVQKIPEKNITLTIGSVDLSKFLPDPNNLESIISPKLEERDDIAELLSSTKLAGTYYSMQTVLKSNLEAQLLSSSNVVSRVLSDPKEKKKFGEILQQTAFRVKSEGLPEIDELNAKINELVREQAVAAQGVDRVSKAYTEEMYRILQPQMDELVRRYKIDNPDNTEEEVRKVREDYERRILAPLKKQINAYESKLRSRINDEVAKVLEENADPEQLRIIDFMKLKRQLQTKFDGTSETICKMARADVTDSLNSSPQSISEVPANVVTRLTEIENIQKKIMSRIDEQPKTIEVPVAPPETDDEKEKLKADNLSLEARVIELTEMNKQLLDMATKEEEIVHEPEHESGNDDTYQRLPLEEPQEDTTDDEELLAAEISVPQPELNTENVGTNDVKEEIAADDTEFDDEKEEYNPDDDEVLDDEVSGDEDVDTSSDTGDDENIESGSVPEPIEFDEDPIAEKEDKNQKTSSIHEAKGKKKIIPKVATAAAFVAIALGGYFLTTGHQNSNNNQTTTQSTSKAKDSGNYTVGQVVSVHSPKYQNDKQIEATVKYQKDGYWWAQDKEGNMWKLPENPKDASTTGTN